MLQTHKLYITRFIVPTLLIFRPTTYIGLLALPQSKTRKNFRQIAFITGFQCLHNITPRCYIHTQRRVHSICCFQLFTQSSFCLKHWVKFTANRSRTYFRPPRNQHFTHRQIIFFCMLNFSCFVSSRNQRPIIHERYIFITQHIMKQRLNLCSGYICGLSTIQKYSCFYFLLHLRSRCSILFGITECWIELSTKNKKSRFQKIFLFRTKFNCWVQKYKLFVSFLFRTFCVISEIHSFDTFGFRNKTVFLLKFLETILKNEK